MSLARTTDPKTSHDAGKNKKDVRAEILAAFKRRPVKGWTDFELEPYIIDRTGVSPQRVRTVRAELTSSLYWTGREWRMSRAERPIVALVDEYRKTPRGHEAQVWVLA